MFKKNRIIVFVVMLLIIFGNVGMCKDYDEHWAKKEIQILQEEKIIQGDEKGNINPNNNITRAEFVKIINKSMGYERAGEEQYKDINGEEWYAQEFLIAKKEGYIQGDENGNANPNNNITRAEVTVILSRILMVSNEEVLKFKDEEQIPKWAYYSVAGLVEEGLISGYEDNTFRANNNITRGESFYIVYKVMKNCEQEENKKEEIKKLEENSSDIEFIHREDGTVGIINEINMNKKINNEQDLKEAMKEIKDIFEIKNIDEEFDIEKVLDDRYVMKQKYKGLEVYGREIVIVLDENNEITTINSGYKKDINISIDNEISEEKAKEIVINKDGETIKESKLVIYTLGEKNELAWSINNGIDMVYLNANTGEEIVRIPLYISNSEKVIGEGIDIYGNSITFDVLKKDDKYYLENDDIKMFLDMNILQPINNNNNIWSTNKKKEGGLFGEELYKNVIRVYDNVLKSNNFYINNLNYSYSQKYEIINMIGSEYINAMASAGKYMTFGQFKENGKYVSYGSSLDIVGHEMTHCVDYRTSKLVYLGESGILEEAYADILGELIQMYYNEDTSWFHGHYPNIGRYIKDPNSTKNPVKIGDEYYDNITMEVHKNSTIISHAAYLMYEKGINNVEVLARLWFKSMKYLNSNSGYFDCRNAVLQAANELKLSDQDIKIIEESFNEVGIDEIPELDFSIIKIDGQSGTSYGNEANIFLNIGEDEIRIIFKYEGNGTVESWKLYSEEEGNVDLGNKNQYEFSINKDNIKDLNSNYKVILKLKEYEKPISKIIKFVKEETIEIEGKIDLDSNITTVRKVQNNKVEFDKKIRIGSDINIYANYDNMIRKIEKFENDQYIDCNDIVYNGEEEIKIRLTLDGGKKKEITIFFLKDSDLKVVLKGINYDGTERVKEYSINDTIIISNSKQVIKSAEILDNSNLITKCELIKTGREALIVNKETLTDKEIIKEYGIFQEDGRYLISIGIAFNNGEIIKKDIYIKIADFGVLLDEVRGVEKNGESRENPILVGEIPAYIQLVNLSGINVVKYEIWNQHTETFETIGNTQNEQWISIPTGGYGFFALDKDYSNNGKVSVGIRMLLEDGTVCLKEIFFKKLILNSPLQGQVIDENKDLVISWNDMGKGVEYRVRMVNLTDKTLNGENTVIYEGEVVSGTSFKIPSNKLKKDKDYRIAVKPEEGTYWTLRTITTHEMETPEIVNMKEKQEIVAEKELSVQMKKELLESEKYYLTITNPSGKEVLKQSISKNIVISAEELKEKGTYKIEVIKVRTVDQAGTIVSGKQTISFKVI